MKKLITTIAMISVASTGAFAQLVGTTVTGTLAFEGGGQFFSPNTQTIVDPTTTFFYQDGANTDTATIDVTGNTLTISDTPSGNWDDATVTETFTDTAFTGATVLSDNFPNGGATIGITGDEISFYWGGGNVNPPAFDAVIQINTGAAPDGGTTVGMLGLALAGLGCIKRKIASR